MANENVDGNGPDQLLLLDKILALTNKSRPTIYRWVKAGLFPPPYRVGGSIVWKQSDYMKWLQELKQVTYR